MMRDKYLVLDWEHAEEHLSNEELEVLFDLLNKATESEPDQKYYVFSEEDLTKKGVSISKEETIRILNELAEVQDIEIAHSEADEALIRYINDKDIEDAYEEVPKWMA